MAWRRPGDKPLSEPMMVRLPTHICVTRPQWVNGLLWRGSTVYPKKYAHGFCFAVLCCGYTLTDFPISIRLTSLALWQSNDCPSASKATLMNKDKYFIKINYERLHNHNKAKHNKTVCIFLGIYCTQRASNIELGCFRCSFVVLTFNKQLTNNHRVAGDIRRHYTFHVTLMICIWFLFDRFLFWLCYVMSSYWILMAYFLIFFRLPLLTLRQSCHLSTPVPVRKDWRTRIKLDKYIVFRSGGYLAAQ